MIEPPIDPTTATDAELVAAYLRDGVRRTDAEVYVAVIRSGEQFPLD